jgi:hypothetical protein
LEISDELEDQTNLNIPKDFEKDSKLKKPQIVLQPPNPSPQAFISHPIHPLSPLPPD